MGTRWPLGLLVITSFVLLLLGALTVFSVFLSDTQSSADAEFVNRVGMIRGGVQRVSNLTALGKFEELSQTQDKLNQLLLGLQSASHRGNDFTDFQKRLPELGTCWAVVQQHLDVYRRGGEAVAAHHVHEKVYECWLISNDLVFVAQRAAESRIASLRLVLYSLFALTFVVVVAMAYGLYFYVFKKIGHDVEHDALTGLFNRRSFDEHLAMEVNRATRYPVEFCLLFIDVDHFKRINDQFGHSTGDEVLKRISETIQHNIRETDSVFRIGGEEIAIICPHTSVEGAYKIAENVREKIAQGIVVKEQIVTVSIGLVGYVEGSTAKVLCEKADSALYRAKNSGRNRTIVFSSSQA